MEEQTAAAVMNYLRCFNVNVFDFIRNAHEFEKKRDAIISKTLISADDRLKDETTTMVAQVLNLKDVLGCGEQSEAGLLAALSKLQRMVISVKVLQSTGIGISVNRLRNHSSKQVAQIAREVVKDWKSIVDEWLKKDNNENNIMQQQIKVQNPPPPRSLVVRIKLKKDDSKEVSTPVLDVSDETVKKVESPSVKTGIGRLVGVPDNETCLKTGRKIEGVDIGKQILIDYECDIFDESVKAKGIGSSVKAVDEKCGSKESGLMVESGNMKKRKIDDGVEEKLNTMWMKKYYVEKKIGIKRLTYDEEIRLRSSTQIKPPHKRQMRRRW